MQFPPSVFREPFAPGNPVSRPGRALLAALLATAGLILASGHGAGATTVSGLRARAAALARRVDTMNTRLGILAEEYDQAHLRAGLLAVKIATTRSEIGALVRKVDRTKREVAHVAVSTYVNSGSRAALVPGASPAALPARQTYLEVAAGSLSSSIAAMRNDQRRLSLNEAVLNAAELQAAQAADTIASARSAAGAVESELQGALADVNGQLTSLVAQQEAAQQEAAAAQAAVAQQAQQAQQAQPSPSSAPGGPPVPSSSPLAGAAAVAAARTQLGIPYVWGGASPGSGFDCSGLTMWAWGQAGVVLPHSAQAQYDATTRVALSDLQPGDLVFYASGGYIYHVIMYIGGGEAVQATDYGQPVQITPVWPGAYGAGRP